MSKKNTSMFTALFDDLQNDFTHAHRNGNPQIIATKLLPLNYNLYIEYSYRL